MQKYEVGSKINLYFKVFLVSRQLSSKIPQVNTIFKIFKPPFSKN